MRRAIATALPILMLLPALIFASPPDPPWVAGFYDGAYKAVRGSQHWQAPAKSSLRAGSGLRFINRGVDTLEGIPGTSQLYSVDLDDLDR